MRMSSYQYLHSQLFGLVLQCFLIAPRNYLMAVNQTDLDSTKLEYLTQNESTFYSLNSPKVSSQQSPFTTWNTFAKDLHQSQISRDPMFPVEKTADTLPGVIISRYLAGTSEQRIGTWKSPTTRASWPIYSSSAMLIQSQQYLRNLSSKQSLKGQWSLFLKLGKEGRLIMVLVQIRWFQASIRENKVFMKLIYLVDYPF